MTDIKGIKSERYIEEQFDIVRDVDGDSIPDALGEALVTDMYYGHDEEAQECVQYYQTTNNSYLIYSSNSMDPELAWFNKDGIRIEVGQKVSVASIIGEDPTIGTVRRIFDAGMSSNEKIGNILNIMVEVEDDHGSTIIRNIDAMTPVD